MAKIKLTKGELKKQKDALRQYERYLPTLQLKKQQLQMEILAQLSLLEEREHRLAQKKKEVLMYSGIFTDNFDIKKFIQLEKNITYTKNVAGVDIACLKSCEFKPIEYDLFLAPLWVDYAILAIKATVCLEEELRFIKKGVEVLRQEMRITTQRVNLFEKVKIPQCLETIRIIKIYLGDQMANAVGRSKITKSKIELEEVLGF
ncbi:MAG: V-type ATP synthase subunit D [Candidatus Omnitrophota bacterium]